MKIYNIFLSQILHLHLHEEHVLECADSQSPEEGFVFYFLNIKLFGRK